jgi:serine/threonine protein kinase
LSADSGKSMAHQYIKGACIGKGSFGEVFRGVDSSTGADVALKLVDLEKADEEIDVRIDLPVALHPHAVVHCGVQLIWMAIAER